MHLEQGDAKIEQPRVDLTGVRAKYLRIAGEPTAFALKGVGAVSDDIVRTAPHVTRVVASASRPKPGEYVFDLGARIPIESVRLALATNTVAPFAFATRDDDKQSWRPLVSATFYNLVRDGATLESPARDVPRTRARYVLATLDSRSPALSAAPRLEVQWRPAQLVFVARGDGPYHLEFGNREAKPSMLSVTELIPGYETHAEMKLHEASVGDIRANAPEEPAWRVAVGETNPRKFALWAILIVAVLVLAGMAWRLSKQMKEPATKPSE
jgi:hypothetical protein